MTGAEHVIAIADAIPPLALSFLQAPAPSSTLTWTLELLKDRLDDLSFDGWVQHAELTAGRDGYTSPVSYTHLDVYKRQPIPPPPPDRPRGARMCRKCLGFAR